MESLIEMKGIRKVFGENVALDQVDFYCKEGEVLCLLGENGAGKTTLMKILYGMYKVDAGQIFYRGNPVTISSPRAAIAMGIQMVHQHFMLVETMTVLDNVMIGREPKKHGLYDRAEARRIVESLSREYGLKVLPDRLIRDISIGERQRVEIIKALYQGADVLILDEPTAVLTPQEVLDLFRIINTLREGGKTIIMITHKLKETMAIADRVMVLRQGQLVGEREVAQTTIDELSQLMVGEAIRMPQRKALEGEGDLVSFMEVHLADAHQGESLKGVNLTIRGREILGIAGVEGNGQAQLIDTLFGLERQWTGDIKVAGQSIKGKHTDDLLALGVACIHADRQAYSIAPSLSVPYNFLMGFQSDPRYLKKGVLIDWKKVSLAAGNALDQYDVRPRDIGRSLEEFSGGNQQKFVVGRETLREPRVLIAAHPTRGVDIKATAFIHQELNRVKAAGGAVLLISSDLDELMALSDRIAVIYDGRIVEVKATEDYTLMELGKLMGGGKAHE